jgi:hypothetical protein
MTLPSYNKLNPAEAERLAMLIEEAGEVVMASSNILERISSKRFAGPEMMEKLEAECYDFLAILRMMHDDLASVYGQVNPDLVFMHNTSGLQERLAILSTAASHVIQIGCKTLRHGYASFHPDTPSRDNRSILAYEVEIMCRMIQTFGAQQEFRNLRDLDEIIRKKSRYMHHQPPLL